MSVRTVQAGSTNVSINIRIIDSTDGTPETGVTSATAGLDLWYRRESAISVDITESNLAALTDAHTDGGMLHINDGWYRVDYPDAAFADGVTGVQIGGTATGMVVLAPYVELVDYNPYDAVRLGLTALPNAAADAAGGLPISDAGGLDLDLYLKSGVTLAGTAAAGSTTTITLTGGVATDKYYNGALVIITGGTGVGQARTILNYVGLTAVATITRDWATAPNGTSTFVVIGADVPAILEAGTAQAGAANSITLDAGASAIDGTYTNNFVMITGGTGIGQTRLIGGYTGISQVAVVSPAWTTNPDATSVYQILPAARVDVGGWLGNLVTGDGDWAQLQTDVDAILLDTAEIGAAGAGLTAIDLPDQTMNITGNITGNLSGSVGSVTGAVGSVTGAVGSVTGNVGGNVTGSVGSVLGAINTAAGVITTLDGLDTAQDSQHSTTQANQTTILNRLGDFAGTGLNTIKGFLQALFRSDGGVTGVNTPSEINEIENAITGTYDGATDSLEAIRDRGDAAWTTGAGSGLTPLASGTAQGGTVSTIQLAAGETFADNEPNGNVIKITGGTGAGQSRVITSYTGITDTAGVYPNWTTTPAADSVYEMVEGSVNLATISLDGTAADNLELDYDGNGYNKSNSTIGTTTTNTDMRGTDNAALAANYTAARAGYLDNLNIGENVAGTSEISGLNDPTAAVIADAVWDEPKAGHTTATTFGDLATDLDAVLVDTGTTLPAQISALNNISVADILTTQMTEAYAADGAAPTLAQSLMLIQQMLGDFAITGTTLTVRKVDGAATAATFTLNDATNPTGITRAT